MNITWLHCSPPHDLHVPCNLSAVIVPHIFTDPRYGYNDKLRSYHRCTCCTAAARFVDTRCLLVFSSTVSSTLPVIVPSRESCLSLSLLGFFPHSQCSSVSNAFPSNATGADRCTSLLRARLARWYVTRTHFCTQNAAQVYPVNPRFLDQRLPLNSRMDSGSSSRLVSCDINCCGVRLLTRLFTPGTSFRRARALCDDTRRHRMYTPDGHIRFDALNYCILTGASQNI